jgi:DNA modification methylase
MKNKFNQITSKEWLPFQKSWYKVSSIENLYRDTIRFFTDNSKNTFVEYYGQSSDIFNKVCNSENLNSKSANKNCCQFVLIDLLDFIKQVKSVNDYELVRHDVLAFVEKLIPAIDDRRFISVLIQNKTINDIYYPFAWDIAKEIGRKLSLKDEKIICYENNNENNLSVDNIFYPAKDYVYQLFFRKDEDNEFNENTYSGDGNFLKNTNQIKVDLNKSCNIDSWFILKPQPRDKLEVLHPAKYPETLVELFVSHFTKPNDYVLDPMSGTGSTQVGALKIGRNAIGTELSEFFCGIANTRCKDFINPKQTSLFVESENKNTYKVLNLDARKISREQFPKIDYVITSPPYWDMLNMKGAENQAKRVEKGLQTNYSDNAADLGNIDDYNSFINELVEIYLSIAKLMVPGSYMTIVVKNIKKKGRNYPFAWDISSKLIPYMTLVKETFWCQDDISIAPFGYGNTWVSNTFHQYCLTFQIKN